MNHNHVAPGYLHDSMYNCTRWLEKHVVRRDLLSLCAMTLILILCCKDSLPDSLAAKHTFEEVEVALRAGPTAILDTC